MDWFGLALLSALAFGIQGFLFKQSSQKGCNKFTVTLVFMLTVELLSVIVFLSTGSKIVYLLPTLVLGFLFAAFFYIKTILDLKALDYLPTSKVFPITSSSAVLVVFYAVFFFNERLNLTEILGICAVITAIMFIHSDSRKHVDYSSAKIGLLIATLAILPGAAMKIVNKYAAVSADTIAFTVITYLFLVIISASGYKLNTRTPQSAATASSSVIIGLLIGIVNFAGFYTHLFALKSGPLSIISTIHASYLVISVLLARLFCGEQLTKKQFALVILSVIGMILLRINPS